MSWFAIYYWIAFCVTFALTLRLPTKLDAVNNFIGTIIVAALGVLLWPIALLAYIRMRSKESPHG